MSALSPLVSHDQDSLRCPAGIYRQLRDEGVRYAPEIDAYVVARHDDVVRVLRDGRTFSSRNTVGRVVAADAPADPHALTPLLLMSDDPVHARRRSIVNRAFTPSKVAAWEPLVRQLAREHVERLRGLPEVDFVRDLAALLPVRVISMVLGVPLEDVAKFREWSEEITSSVGHHGGDPERRQQVQEQFSAYIGSLLDRWDGVVGTSVLSQIAAAERAGELSRHEGVRFTAELLVAGNITTTHHISSSIALLARTPGIFGSHPSRAFTGSPWPTPRSAAWRSPRGRACSCSTGRRTRTTRPGRTARTCGLTGRTARPTWPSARARTPASAPRSPGLRAALSWSSSLSCWPALS
jgi:cytochrome P450